MGVKKRDNLSISGWIRRFSHLIRPAGSVLDLAAGSGRHSAWCLDLGHRVTAVDRRTDELETLRNTLSEDERQRLEIVVADLEDGSPWPLANRCFDAVVVVNYLHRPLFPGLLAALAPGGVFLYDTFAAGNEAFGKPSRPDFLLQPGELLERVGGASQIVAYEHGRIDGALGPAVKQRIAAIGGQEHAALTSS
ncbi:MAG: class I SAM-dependent methyltransferase [Geminicoccaceae bacterium]